MNNIYNNGTPANVGDSVAAIPGRLGVLAQVTIASIRPDGTAPVTLADGSSDEIILANSRLFSELGIS